MHVKWRHVGKLPQANNHKLVQQYPEDKISAFLKSKNVYFSLRASLTGSWISGSAYSSHGKSKNKTSEEECVYGGLWWQFKPCMTLIKEESYEEINTETTVTDTNHTHIHGKHSSFNHSCLHTHNWVQSQWDGNNTGQE